MKMFQYIDLSIEDYFLALCDLFTSENGIIFFQHNRIVDYISNFRLNFLYL